MTDVALAKLATMRRRLQRIEAATGGDPTRVRNLDTQDIVVLNLQRAVQAAIDLAAHLIARSGWGLPDSLKAHFAILARERVIDADLCRQLEAMVGFRNIAVHDYQTLDIAVLERIVAERLPDLAGFADAVTRHLAAGSPPAG